MLIKRWKSGEQIVGRSMWHGKIVAALPMTVVLDSEKVLVLFLAAGTAIKVPSTYPYREGKTAPKTRGMSHLPIGDWKLVDDIWTTDLVRIMYPGDQHAYYAIWKEGHFSHWYVNLESAYRRTPSGIDFEDHILDIRIQADMTTWEWKDEDELVEAVALGLISQAQADSTREEGLRAIKRLEAKSPPFDQGWEGWKPDPTWTIPKLPASWQLSVRVDSAGAAAKRIARSK